MIKSITVTNHLNKSITIELSRPEKSGLAVISIDGLGPVKANVSTSKLASHDGSVFNSARLDERDINMTLELMPVPSKDEISTVEKVRHLVYKYFPIKRPVRVEFETDTRSVYVNGIVDDDQPNIFSEKERMTISIRCPDPWFYSVKETNTTFSGIVPKFVFPFSSPVGNPSLHMGEIVTNTINNIYYEGDNESGVIISIHAIGPATHLRIYNIDTHESMAIDDDKLLAITGSKIKASDDIIINTRQNSKKITLIREGIKYNILNTLNKNPSWFTVNKGDNQFAFTADDDDVSNPLNLRFDIETVNTYEGV